MKLAPPSPLNRDNSNDSRFLFEPPKLNFETSGPGILVIGICLAIVAACAPPAKPRTESGPAAKVFVQADGAILLNGQPTTLENLKKELATLKGQNGTVWYSRANPAGEPPPHAMEVIQAIADAGLPVRLMEKPE